MKAEKTGGIIGGSVCFAVFLIPWLYLIFSALRSDPHGFRAEGIIGIFIGIVIFAIVSSFLGYSISKKSIILIVISSILVLAVPAIWWYFAWLP
jgi:hypothetical protein